MDEAKKNRFLFCVWLTLLFLFLGVPLWVTHWFSSRTALFELAKDVSWADRGDWNATQNPDGLSFSAETRLSKAQLKMIGGFVGLHRLTIGGLTDADLTLLRGVKALQSLTLTEASISDEGLKIISEFPVLRELRISETPGQMNRGRITTAGMNDLGTMIGLTILRISSRQLTDENISPLSGCISLQALDMASPNIHGAGLKPLQSLSQLRDLRLDGCRIDDESGLRSLTQITSLRQVWLRNCGNLDGPIQTFAAMSQLEKLHLENSEVTAPAIIQLRSARPELWIFDPSGLQWPANSTEPEVIR